LADFPLSETNGCKTGHSQKHCEDFAAAFGPDDIVDVPPVCSPVAATPKIVFLKADISEVSCFQLDLEILHQQAGSIQ
jgi:hypothetical protein